MKLNKENLKETSFFSDAKIKLPGYDVDAVHERTKETPVWVHFGIGNIFRIFIGAIADGLLENGDMDRGLICAETYDFDVVDKIYTPFDNLALSVILLPDHTKEEKVLAPFAESLKAVPAFSEDFARMKEIFRNESLQMVSFTITEKGYALTDADGKVFPWVSKDLAAGPESDHLSSAMTVVTTLLYERFKAGKKPLALVSMDNCSSNGKVLRDSVLDVAHTWAEKKLVPTAFVDYVSDEDTIAFPWTMIDKITPRPADNIAKSLADRGIEDMDPVITGKHTYIAPFINAEDPQYLVIEDHFPNGRPNLARGKGVYLGSRDTVNKAERMKVTALLNPVHSAVGPAGVLVGEEYFADMLNADPVMMAFAKKVAMEGMDVCPDPVVISPQTFLNELFEYRFINEALGDTNLRLPSDESQGVGIRFGETAKSYLKKYGSTEKLSAVPLGVASWLRYMMGIDDAGKAYDRAPDPMNVVFDEVYKDVCFGRPETYTGQLRPILSNERLFYCDLYAVGLGDRIEKLFVEMIEKPGSVRRVIEREVAAF